MHQFFENKVNTTKTKSNGLKLKQAVRENNAKQVAFWLQDSSVNATCKGMALQEACIYGYVEITKILLTDKSISKVFKNSAFKIAIEKRHHAIINFMIVEPDISEANQRSALLMSQSKYVEYKEHANSLRIKTCNENRKTFLKALSNGDGDSMEPLLALSEITPEYKALALYEAAKDNHIDIVTLLLTDSNFTDEDILWAQKIARMQNHNDIELLLLNHLMARLLTETTLTK